MLYGCLSISNNNVLEDVVNYRQTKPVEYSLPPNIKEYSCLIGLPYGYKHLIGKEIYFYSSYDKRIHGPWLVVDVESITHQGQMFSRRLAADINCKEYKSHYGVLMLYEYNRIN